MLRPAQLLRSRRLFCVVGVTVVSIQCPRLLGPPSRTSFPEAGVHRNRRGGFSVPALNPVSYFAEVLSRLYQTLASYPNLSTHKTKAWSRAQPGMQRSWPCLFARRAVHTPTPHENALTLACCIKPGGPATRAVTLEAAHRGWLHTARALPALAATPSGHTMPHQCLISKLRVSAVQTRRHQTPKQTNAGISCTAGQVVFLLTRLFMRADRGPMHERQRKAGAKPAEVSSGTLSPGRHMELREHVGTQCHAQALVSAKEGETHGG